MEALLGRCGQGDVAAFGTLYDLTVTRLFPLVMGVVGDETTAERVVREGYGQVWRYAGRYSRSQGSAWGWVVTTVYQSAQSARQHRNMTGE